MKSVSYNMPHTSKYTIKHLYEVNKHQNEMLCGSIDSNSVRLRFPNLLYFSGVTSETSSQLLAVSVLSAVLEMHRLILATLVHSCAAMFAHPASPVLCERIQEHPAPHGLICSKIVLFFTRAEMLLVLSWAGQDTHACREISDLNKLCTWRASMLWAAWY